MIKSIKDHKKPILPLWQKSTTFLASVLIIQLWHYEEIGRAQLENGRVVGTIVSDDLYQFRSDILHAIPKWMDKIIKPLVVIVTINKFMLYKHPCRTDRVIQLTIMGKTVPNKLFTWKNYTENIENRTVENYRPYLFFLFDTLVQWIV